MQKTNQAKHVIHAYLKGTLASGYRKCSLCDNRSRSICIKCRCCYTCHYELLSEQALSEQEKYEYEQRKIIDVYGQLIEPICNYRACKHKFSVHSYDAHKCKCRHALNYAAGISLYYLEPIECLFGLCYPKSV